MQTQSASLLVPPPGSIETDIYVSFPESSMKKLLRESLEPIASQAGLTATVLYDCEKIKREFSKEITPYKDFFSLDISALPPERIDDAVNKYWTAHKLRADHITDLWLPKSAVSARYWMHNGRTVLKIFEKEVPESPLLHEDDSLEYLVLPGFIPETPMSSLWVRRSYTDSCQLEATGIDYNPYNTAHTKQMDAHPLLFKKNSVVNRQMKEYFGPLNSSEDYNLLAQKVIAYVTERLDEPIDLT